ncbi:MAG: 2Fe-2S iron-sulfur cluster-binding protein, partial [Chloroflexota bacterium]|nr:2Fe-2S iron-sulfur cluster-binding protein [Chloroflexota bacterium]
MTQGSNPAPPPAPENVNLTINGQQLSAPKGTLLVEAAKLIGLEIPIFCYHPKLKPVGACRMCLVQIEKLPRLQTACTTPVAADMVVYTNTPEVIAAQNGVIELLLANHPLDCPICDKGGECPLQDNTFNYG